MICTVENKIGTRKKRNEIKHQSLNRDYGSEHGSNLELQIKVVEFDRRREKFIKKS